MLIGLCGYKGSGKDTAAAYLVKNHGYERRAFADPLKKHVAALFGINFHEVDKLKNDPNAVVELTIPSGNALAEDRRIRMLFREFLQRDGTEAHRDVPEMGTDFWVDLTLPMQGYYVDRNIVVSDVRFENEARRIRYLRGVVVEVVKSGLVSKDQHRSEQINFEPDYEIFNNGTIEDLYTGIEALLDRLNQTGVGSGD